MKIDCLHGAFVEEGSAYEIIDRGTPRPWFNALWNDQLCSWVSHTGQGESVVQDDHGHRVPVACARQVFVQDVESQAFFPVGGGPEWLPLESYHCLHREGETLITTAFDGLRACWTLRVSAEDACECWTLQLENVSGRMRRLRVLWFADTKWGGGLQHQAYYNHVRGRFDTGLQAGLLTGASSWRGHPEASVFLVLAGAVDGYDLTHSGVVGAGTELDPACMRATSLRGVGCEMEKAVLALEQRCALAAGAEWVGQALLGVVSSPDEIIAMRDRNFRIGHSSSRQQKPSVVFQTPDKRLDALATHWLPRQIRLGARWARVRHNGFRDIVQDATALAGLNVAESEAALTRILSFQYASGFAPRTFIDGKILDHGYVDNAVWIAAAVHRAVMERGTPDFLYREVAFNDAPPAPVHEHIRRAMDYLWERTGHHGLLRIGGGDWNDAMNRVGLEGQGVSVWLSMAWCWAARHWAELAEWMGDSTTSSQMLSRCEEMAGRINASAWSEAGGYYVRAFHDDGGVIGSPECEEGKIFLLPQAWAVLSGVADSQRAHRALESAEALLMDHAGIRKLTPAFTHWDPRIGSITRKTPESFENGGVYLHAMAFKLVADCIMRRHGQVGDALVKICPFSNPVASSHCEPYVLCNSYQGKATGYRYGTPGQSWGTGGAGWLHRALSEYVFGLRPRRDGLYLEPCLPESWSGTALVRHFRGAEYHLNVGTIHPGGRPVVEVDGKPHDPAMPLPLPDQEGKRVTVKLSIQP